MIEELRKETLEKVRSLQFGMQEPLFSEFSQFKDLREIVLEINSNLIKLDSELIKERLKSYILIKKGKTDGK